MNRFQFLGSQADEQGQEWCYVFDTKTGTTLKSLVRVMGNVQPGTVTMPPPTGGPVPAPMVFPDDTIAAPVAVKKEFDPTGELETAEERKIRLGGHKVPPAFLGDTRRMHLDPSKNDNGVTDVTPTL